MSVNVRGEDHSIRFAQFEPTQAPFGVHDGAMWYDLQGNTFKCRVAGTTTNCGSGGTTSPAGANTQIQFNNSGSFGADAHFTFDPTGNQTFIASAESVTIDTHGLGSGQVFIGAGATNLNFANFNQNGITFSVTASGDPAIGSVDIASPFFSHTSNKNNGNPAASITYKSGVQFLFQPKDAATSGANFASPVVAVSANAWNGATTFAGGYYLQAVPGAGTNPEIKFNLYRDNTFFANAGNSDSVLSLGLSGSAGARIDLIGTTSGIASLGVAAAAGTPNRINLPTTTGAKNSIIQSDGGNPQQLSWSGNCTSSASPAVCGSAVAGSVVIAAAATTVVVNTTAVTANSQIILTEDSSLGSKLSVTCNTQSTLVIGSPTVSARTAGTSFTITLPVAPTTNPACFSYLIVN